MQKQLKTILKSGEVIFGTNTVLSDVQSGNVKVVVISKNCPKEIEEDIKKYTSLANIPIVVFDGTSMELGEFCGKPFLIAAISIRNLGKVSLKEFVKEEK